MANASTDSPDLEYSDTSALDKASGLEIADAVDAASAKSAASGAGNTLSVSGSSTTSPEAGAVDSGAPASNSTAPFPTGSAVAASSVAMSSAAVIWPAPSASVGAVANEVNTDCGPQLIYV